MQPAATEAASQSFAGLLASLAAPAKPSTPDPNGDGLADDVAVLSYAGALQSRKKFTAAPFAAATGAGEDSPSHAAAPAAPTPAPPAAIHGGRITITEADVPSPKTPSRPLKAASITIRVSAAECAQLRARAAEAGLTVSAYLRSCIFEVESLRAQVKDTLAQLRSSSSSDDRKPTPAPPKPGPLPAHTWRSRLLPGWKTSRRLETA
jgi:hypothetical protein